MEAGRIPHASGGPTRFLRPRGLATSESRNEIVRFHQHCLLLEVAIDDSNLILEHVKQVVELQPASSEIQTALAELIRKLEILIAQLHSDQDFVAHRFDTMVDWVQRR
eukprot:Skav230873  [mRNA]  locus=scaffold1335:457056:457379:- [translate_table: standard]